MMIVAMILAATAASGLGSMYSGGVLVHSPDHTFCSTRYKFTTVDPIDAVASF